MLFTTLQVIGGILGIASSVLGIISFWRDRIRHRTAYVIGALALAAASLYLYTTIEENQQKIKINQLRNQVLIRDASVVSDSIVITGWEDVGDYVGYLSQITGFYERHSEEYKSERTTYARQLQEWQDYLKKIREEGKTLYPSDLGGLKGLVAAGDDHLERIAHE